MRNERLPYDDSGHLIARAFGGSKDIDNLVPQSKYINRSFKENGEWYNMEKEWRKAIDKGKNVKNIKIKVKYEGQSQRPSGFSVLYEIGSARHSRYIHNI